MQILLQLSNSYNSISGYAKGIGNVTKLINSGWFQWILQNFAWFVIAAILIILALKILSSPKLRKYL